jgi:sugar lactone lactonase YvrE
VDCATLPGGLLPHELVVGPKVGEDFDFDAKGNLIAHRKNALWRSAYPPGASEPFAYTDGGPGGPASLRLLHDGDVIYANMDTATVYRVSPAGLTTPLTGVAYPTGLTIHQDGTAFLLDLSGLLHIDPDAGTVDVLMPAPGSSWEGITFSVDHSWMYIGDRFDGLTRMPVDPQGTPTGPAEPFGEAPDGFGELLGLGVDVCDNVYAVYNGNQLLRYSPEGGTPEVLVEGPDDAWFTNLQWGSGVGGWDDHVLYINDRSESAVYWAVQVEVPSK